jgi:hypothetical protein
MNEEDDRTETLSRYACSHLDSVLPIVGLDSPIAVDRKLVETGALKATVGPEMRKSPLNMDVDMNSDCLVAELPIVI